MTKLVLVLFTALTIGAGYLTFYHVGVEDGSVIRGVRNEQVVRSVRQGSASNSRGSSRIK